MKRAFAAIAALALMDGCAVTVDAFYRMAGPKSHSTQPEAELATGRVDTWREISFDADGLICREVYGPWTRPAEVGRSVVNPNGYKAATQTFTVLEALIVGAAVIGNEIACSQQTCMGSDRWAIDAYAIPFALDIAWGTYRSFTIHNEILKSSHVSWGAERPSEPLDGIAEQCAVGTDIALTAGGEQLIVRIDQGGRVAALQLPQLAVFLEAHASFDVAGEHVKLDLHGAPRFVTAVRAAAQVAAAAQPPATPPPPPPPPSVIAHQLNVILPIPVRVLIVAPTRDHR